MKSFVWFVSVALAVATMTGFVFLSDADLFDLFKSGSSYNQRSRWKRSRLYPQYVLPPDQDKQHFQNHQEEDGHQHSTASASLNSHRSRLSSTEFWSNEDYAQLMPRPTPFPPNHFINQPYFESQLPEKAALHSLRTYTSVAKRQQLYTERPTTSHHKVTREVHHNIEHPTKRTSFVTSLAPTVQTKEQHFNDLDIPLKSSESKSKPSFTKMFQKALIRRNGETKKSAKQKEVKKETKHEIAQQRDYRHGGGSYGGSYHQPPVYYIPNHHKEKDYSVLLKIFLLAILIPLGVCIALAVIAAFFTGVSAYGRYLVTYVNSTNTTYYFFNGLNGFGGLTNLFGVSGLIGAASASSGSTAAVVQQQQQQQTSSNNNNNNNNDNNSNNNNNVAVIVVNITGRANNDDKLNFLGKPFKMKSANQDEDSAMDYF
ncbi:uncharacterized protein LOC130691659 isoform X2 [Daphnia carinata]|uniref:uncharacterized protein LOC130691659 isoform X2 n=1 Tax=Daphnia carinata TaxID=120202 RepID=UPI00257B294B|nr:uncharacterized protein LOC130691659 isoform X2 [Daphnia carinata]